MILAGLAVTLCLAWVIGHRLLHRPLAGLLATTQRWRGGDYGARSELHGPTELGRLGAAFGAMADEVERTLAHKDLLLHELSHRISNSLQMLGSLFALQARSAMNGPARAQLDEASGRVRSVALAYRRLQAASGEEMVDFAEFLHDLWHDLQTTLLPARALNDSAVTADPLLLRPDQAVPLALVANGLVTIALKHGAGDASGMAIKLGRSSEGCRLAVRNRGALPAGYDPAARAGFGLRMVLMMCKQLNGRLEAASLAGETEFAVTFAPRLDQPPVLKVVDSDGEHRSRA